jgi:hypothetical protein
MPVAVYPAILTKADWDKNKGAISKHPNELGIGLAVVAAEGNYKNIDRKALVDITPQKLKEQSRNSAFLLSLLPQVQRQLGRVREAYDALIRLADVTGGVVARYERAVTFPKPVIEHVRKMNAAALELVGSFGKEQPLEKELLLARKARGLARLQELKLASMLENPTMCQHFMTWARKPPQLCDEQFEFLVGTFCTTKGQTPTGDKAVQLYEKFIVTKEVNIDDQDRQAIAKYKGQLRTPTPEASEALKNLWWKAHISAKNMFDSSMGSYGLFQKDAIVADNPILLMQELQY